MQSVGDQNVSLNGELRELRARVARLEEELQTLRRAAAAVGVTGDDIAPVLADLVHLFHTAPVGLALIDTALRYRLINDALAAMNGRPAREHLGRTLREIVPDIAGKVEPVYRQVIKSGEAVLHAEVHGATPASGDADATYAVSYYPLKMEDGTVRGVTTVVQDITRRRRAERAFHEQGDLLRSVIEGTEDPIFVKDTEGRYVLVNSADARGFGRSVQEIVGLTDRELLEPESAAQAAASDREVIRRGEPITCEQEFRTPEGDRRVYSLSKYPRFDDDGKVIGVVGIARDISSRMQMEGALRESERMLLTLMSNLPGMAYRCRNHPEWTMEFVSEGCVGLTGFAPGDLIGNRRVAYARLIHPDDRPAVWDQVQAAVSARASFRLVYRIHDAEGREKWVWEQGRGVYSDAGELLALEGFITDISEQKRGEEALRQAHQDLEERVRARTADLLATNERLEREIAERRRSEEALRRQQQEQQIIMDSVPAMIWYKDCNNRILRVNRTAAASIGLSVAQVEGRSTGELYPDEADQYHRDDLEVIRSGVPKLGIVELLLTASGEKRWIRTDKVPYRDESGRIIGIIVLAIDITEQKRSDDALRASEKRYQVLMDLANDAIFVADARTGMLLDANKKAQEMTGRTVAEIRAMPQVELHPPEERERYAAMFRQQVARGTSLMRDLVLVHRNGRRISVDVSASVIETGGRLIVQGIFRDITERKRAEEALSASEQRLQAIIDNSTAVIYLKAADGRYLLINRRFEELFHVRRDQVVTKTDLDIFPREVADAFRANDRKVLETLQPIIFEETAPHDDGVHTYVSVKFPMLDAEGVPYGVCGISTDITDRKRGEEELRRARESAEAANRAKSRFLANMSHEIRTPITAMLGAAELLPLADHDASERRRRTDMILRNGRHLLALIDDLLDLSRLEAGRLRVQRARASLLDIIADVQAVTAPLHTNERVEFRIQYETPVPPYIHTDATRLKQAIINLVSNALKFTEQGNVDVRVRCDGSGDAAMLAVAVEDTGIGIPPSDLARIFEAFTQVEPKAARASAGVGLGLTIARWIAEQLGGDLSVSTRTDHGSTFTLRVAAGPLDDGPWVTPGDVRVAAPAYAAPPSGGAAPPFRRRLRGSVLLAEDFPDARELLRYALASAGAAVTTVSNGEDAVRAATEKSFDLILMDIRMPRMDGLAATCELRRRGCLTPIIALTASTAAADRDPILKAGFDDYWSKPIALDRLLEGAAAYLGSDEDGSPASSPVEEHKARPVDPRLAALATAFVRSLPARVETLRGALAAGDVEGAHMVLHQLVGTAGIHGLMDVSRLAADLIALLKQGRLQAKTEGVVHLEQMTASLVASLGPKVAPRPDEC